MNVDKFWSQVNRSDDTCWIWTGYSNNDGYGRLRFNNKLTMAHRVAYQLLVGEIPVHKELDHLCRNRICVNPSHLEVVTHKENMERGISRCSKKVCCKRGHSLSGGNLIIKPDKSRQCRKCINFRRRLYYRRKCIKESNE